MAEMKMKVCGKISWLIKAMKIYTGVAKSYAARQCGSAQSNAGSGVCESWRGSAKAKWHRIGIMAAASAAAKALGMAASLRQQRIAAWHQWLA